MDIDFSNIEYLRNGNERQRRAFAVLTKHQILQSLREFDPILVGTIPINIDIVGSDLDIICHYRDESAFTSTVKMLFNAFAGFHITETRKQGQSAIIVRFHVDEFEVEIFGQNVPTKLQLAYRHMIIEHKLLSTRDASFRQDIIDLKQQGHKTEPAFAIALGLKGNPYEALLGFEEA